MYLRPTICKYCEKRFIMKQQPLTEIQILKSLLQQLSVYHYNYITSSN